MATCKEDLTEEEKELLYNTKGLMHDYGSPVCWCNPTVTENENHIIFKHHFPETTLKVLLSVYTTAKPEDFGVVRIPKKVIAGAVALGQKMSALVEGRLKEH